MFLSVSRRLPMGLFILMALSILLFGLSTALKASDFDAKHKVVIQVSTKDPMTQKIALNNAVNLQKLYGMDNVAIEIVAYGPGLGLLTTKGDQATRVKSLAQQNITFSACGNTMKNVEKKSGKKPELTEGVQIVNAGVARILELQSDGYGYIRP